MYKRFKWDERVSITGFYPADKMQKIKPSKIFICSTFELFHPEVSKNWRDLIFNVIKKYPHHTFQILTKLPQNIDREMPENVWLGISVTNRPDVLIRAEDFGSAKARIKFVSVEPFLESLGILPYPIDWCIIGRLTGHGKKHNPTRKAIKRIVETCQHDNIPVFLKDNLREIWGEPLIQEFPE